MADDVEPLDVIVVGAGPAGLTAALYLTRFRRTLRVFHDGQSRAGWIPRTQNHPGFPDGVVGTDLLARIRAQAERFGADIVEGQVEAVTPDGDGFVVSVDGQPHRARAVLVATGVVDKVPNLPGVEDAVRRALLRICPICDGFEVTGQTVAVIGDDALGAREAVFLTTYTDDITLLHTGEAEALPAAERERLAAAGITLIEGPVSSLAFHTDRKTAICMSKLGEHRFDAVYSALGVRPRCDLVVAAGATVGEDGRLIVDDHQETTVKGLFAAGDLVRGLNQITTAEGEAAIAATAIHNRLLHGS